MLIQYLSDLHFEFHEDGGQSFLDSFHLVGDVLVVAGDLDTSTGIERSLRRLAEAVSSKPILYVPGNHDYYDSNAQEVNKRLRAVSEDVSNLMVPHNESVMIHRVQFHGTPLWFPERPGNAQYKRRLTDFSAIDARLDEFHEWNRKARTFLDENVSEGDVVITHHAPSFQSVASHFEDSALTRYFVSDESDLIKERNPAVWIHGHMHGSKSYELNETRVHCNPLGYQGREENPDFKPQATVEVEQP